MNELGEWRGVATRGAAVIVAVAFFAAVAAVFASIASASMAAVYALIALAVIGMAYVATGGRSWFGTRERPERIIGARLRFSDVEGSPHTASLPDAVVREWNGREYRAEFIEPLGAGTERDVLLAARQAGYPVSRVSGRRGCFVNGRIANGDRFIAMVRRVREPSAR